LRTGYNERYITKLMGDYAKQGLEEFLRIKHTSHYRLLDENEEAKILAEIEKEAEAGMILTIGDLTAAFEKKLGRKASKMYIYRLLKRHGWRKILPRSKHPKSADKEAVSASKKLNPVTTN
ncbi:MAG: winged helix-turn-helix domain-containing protein, partial [Oscillospiraceae bacterium]|nr:winged helix-turn-helix domain-containing protein [Oscillospiraceae bacterium]